MNHRGGILNLCSSYQLESKQTSFTSFIFLLFVKSGLILKQQNRNHLFRSTKANIILNRISTQISVSSRSLSRLRQQCSVFPSCGVNNGPLFKAAQETLSSWKLVLTTFSAESRSRSILCTRGEWPGRDGQLMTCRLRWDRGCLSEIQERKAPLKRTIIFLQIISLELWQKEGRKTTVKRLSIVMHS